MSGNNGVQIPVSLQLQNINEQVAKLKKLVQDNINIDSSSFKKLNGLLGQSERGLMAMSQMIKRTFTSTADVHKFENSLTKVYDKTSSIVDAIKNMSFTDFSFSDKELGLVKELEKEIKDSEALIKKYKKGIGIVGSDEFLEGFSIRTDGRSLGEIERDINAEKKRAEEQIRQYEETIAKLNKISNQDSYTKTDRNFLTESLGLSSQELQNQVKITESALFKIEEISSKMAKERERVFEMENAQQTIEDGKARREGAIARQVRAQEYYREELEKEKAALAAAKKETLALETAQLSLTKEYQTASKVIAASEAELQKLTTVQNKLSNIQFAVKRWFGFNEILNLTKNTIRNVVTHIHELDDTMTEIAIVTDMTQKQLWGQVSAYSALAKQYGATIKGVYEVSQLYYQQGMVKHLTFSPGIVI